VILAHSSDFNECIGRVLREENSLHNLILKLISEGLEILVVENHLCSSRGF